MLYVAGPNLNALTGAASITLSPVADSSFPAANLYDGVPESIMLFSSTGPNAKATIDLNRITNGDFEDAGGYLTGWTSTGGVANETTLVHAGSDAVRLNDAGSDAKIEQTLTLRSGTRYRLSVWFRIATSAVITAQLFDNKTRRYLTSGSAWTTSASQCITKNTGVDSYENLTVDFTTESLEEVGVDTTSLTLTIETTVAFNSYVDDVELFQAVNLCSVHGHNISFDCEARYSTDNFSASNVLAGTMVPARGSFYDSFTRTYARYWRFIVGLDAGSWTSNEATYLGELVLADVETIGQTFKHKYEITRMQPQARNVSSTGRVVGTKLTDVEQRILKMSFRHTDNAGEDETEVKEILARASYGVSPALIVPDETRADVILGTLEDAWDLKHIYTTVRDGDLALSELPFPRVIL